MTHAYIVNACMSSMLGSSSLAIQLVVLSTLNTCIMCSTLVTNELQISSLAVFVLFTGYTLILNTPKTRKAIGGVTTFRSRSSR